MQDLSLAITLVRPFPLLKINGSEFEFTKERYGSLKRAYVITEGDLMATMNFQLWMIENNPPNIVVEIKGSDHMVMISKPIELAYKLGHIAQQVSLLDF